jgi:hypothetical protein
MQQCALPLCMVDGVTLHCQQEGAGHTCVSTTVTRICELLVCMKDHHMLFHTQVLARN